MYAKSSKSHHQNVVETVSQYPGTQFLHSFDELSITNYLDWEYAKKLKVGDKTFPILNTQLDGDRPWQQHPCAKNRRERSLLPVRNGDSIKCIHEGVYSRVQEKWSVTHHSKFNHNCMLFKKAFLNKAFLNV
jgi:hypothetical protein